MVSVVNKLIPVGHPNRPGIKLLGKKARVWHGTANLNHGANDTMNAGYASRSYKKRWNEEKKKFDFFEVDGKTPFMFGSAHVYIDVDSATIAIPFDEVAYGCGDRQMQYQNTMPGVEGYKGQRKLAYDMLGNMNNSYTLNIELCMDRMDKWDLVCQNGIWFVKEYMPGLQLGDLRHFDLTGKVCPSPFVNMNIKEIDPKWFAFKSKLREAMRCGS